MIDKIYIMADITRCCDGKDGILKWLGGLMEGIINRICDIPFYEFSNEELKNFWAEILSPLIKTKNIYKININNIHNRFRRILGTSWGYYDSDSTFISNYFKEIGRKS